MRGVAIMEATLIAAALSNKNKAQDLKMTNDLIRADDTIILGDKGYVSETCKWANRARGITWVLKDKRKPEGICCLHKSGVNRNMASYMPRLSTYSDFLNASLVIARCGIVDYSKILRRCSAFPKHGT
jgi:hypothetical protein